MRRNLFRIVRVFLIPKQHRRPANPENNYNSFQRNAPKNHHRTIISGGRNAKMYDLSQGSSRPLYQIAATLIENQKQNTLCSAFGLK